MLYRAPEAKRKMQEKPRPQLQKNNEYENEERQKIGKERKIRRIVFCDNNRVYSLLQEKECVREEFKWFSSQSPHSTHPLSFASTESSKGLNEKKEYSKKKQPRGGKGEHRLLG